MAKPNIRMVTFNSCFHGWHKECSAKIDRRTENELLICDCEHHRTEA